MPVTETALGLLQPFCYVCTRSMAWKHPLEEPRYVCPTSAVRDSARSGSEIIQSFHFAPTFNKTGRHVSSGLSDRKSRRPMNLRA